MIEFPCVCVCVCVCVCRDFNYKLSFKLIRQLKVFKKQDKFDSSQSCKF